MIDQVAHALVVIRTLYLLLVNQGLYGCLEQKDKSIS